MVNHLPSLWKDTCKVQIAKEVIKPNRATGFELITLCEDEPCKLSFYNSVRVNDSTVEGSYAAAAVFQNAKLFIRADLDIPAGSTIIVITHKNKKELHFKASSISAIFTNHQEIVMEYDQAWA